MSWLIYDLDDDRMVESNVRGIKDVLIDAQRQLKVLKERDETPHINN